MKRAITMGAMHFAGWYARWRHGKGPHMANGRRDGMGGGVFIAIGALGGIFAGRAVGQISLGLIAGLIAGAAAALGLWWFSRR